jgi:hypothetical protein
MGQRFAAMLAELPDELKLGPVDAAITRSFERRQADARDVALAALDSDRYLALHDWIDALIADPLVTARATRKAKRELPKSIRRAYHRVKRRWPARIARPTSTAETASPTASCTQPRRRPASSEPRTTSRGTGPASLTKVPLATIVDQGWLSRRSLSPLLDTGGCHRSVCQNSQMVLPVPPV